MAERAVVVGAGWAGIAAALALRDAGWRVLLLERRARAGGRAFSFQAADGTVLDNGQHVLLGCCTRFLALLERVGMAHAVRLQPRLEVPVHGPGGWATLGSARLPGPVHLLPALLRYRHLDPRRRLAAVRAARDLGRAADDRQTFAAWLAARGQDELAVARLWDLVGVPVLNRPSWDVSAQLATRTLHLGFGRGWQAARLGLFTAPLGELADAAVRTLRALGVEVRLGCAARAVAVRRGRAEGVVLPDGSACPADAVVAAVPPDALLALLPAELRAEPPFRDLPRLGWSPIFNLYLRYDRPVWDGELFAELEEPLPFVFNRGRLLGGELDGRLLAVSVSAADALLGLPPAELADRLEGVLRRALPRARSARREAAFPVWQARATFRGAPGCAAWRPGAATPVPGLFLAGDWTDTGWPACLEGAVRSGEAAAAAAGRRPAAGVERPPRSAALARGASTE